MAMTGFTDEDARRSWNSGASAWPEFVRSGADYYRTEVHGPALLRACGDVGGLRVLDLGCGEGYFSRALAALGASVTGIDLSDGMLEAARALENEDELGIDYRLMSAVEIGTTWGPASFDLVTGCMSLQDMCDPAGVMTAARRVLVPEGRFVCSVPHSLTDVVSREWERAADGSKKALKIDGYFESGPAVCSWNMARLRSHWETPYWRRTLSEWTEMSNGAGFRIRRIHEPRPSQAQVRKRPELEDCFRLPYFLVFDLIVSTSES